MDVHMMLYDVGLCRSLALAGISRSLILFYEHILTLGSEIQYIWPTRRTYGSAWFLCIRYFSFGANIIVVLDTFATFDVEACNALNTVGGFLILGQEFMVGCTLCLRVYAMYSLSKRLLVFVACAVIIGVAVCIWSVIPVGTTPSVPVRAPGCFLPQSRAQNLRMLGAWGTQLAGNVLAISLTLYRGSSHAGGATAVAGSLWGVLIRDGIAYFVAILVVNFGNILMFYFGDIYTGTSLAWFTSVISVVMILRLMINLHLTAAPNTNTEPETFGFTLTAPIHFHRGYRDESNLVGGTGGQIHSRGVDLR
ncbi:hypothetical protein DFH07DRAFT_936214 [Mycena maculata]|uniref:DUF6533 domain-containing protein n=1 Tax=Mycena maculata TaxID=230809 RepID=A0AAD7NXI3_9AGAR|nr:hypothetical protein DFH07DRAFT_936214 [Mycena maculata]